jgi:hypothetical protein
MIDLEEVSWETFCDMAGASPEDGDATRVAVAVHAELVVEDEDLTLQYVEACVDEALDAVRCQCGSIIGGACSRILVEEEDIEGLEWVPEWRRGTAQTLGSWQGLSEKLRVHWSCVDHAALNCDGTPDPWVREVEG